MFEHLSGGGLFSGAPNHRTLGPSPKRPGPPPIIGLRSITTRWSSRLPGLLPISVSTGVIDLGSGMQTHGLFQGRCESETLHGNMR